MLPELAAMAADKVPGFKRPMRDCDECGGSGCAFGYQSDPGGGVIEMECDDCLGEREFFDNEPAALAMAVDVYVTKYACRVELDGERVVVSTEKGVGTATLPDAKPETIAKARLVALLRAHGEDVPE